MDETTIDAIHRLLAEMDETKERIRVVRDAVKDVLEQNDEYRQLQEELKELTAKRLQAKKILQADLDYQKIAGEMEELKFKLKDLQEIMSHHLVTYYNETQATEIKTPDGEARQVILSAKIGKAEVVMNEQ
jgi:predicted  nucleic acid-binding Zn-ribbon protein